MTKKIRPQAVPSGSVSQQQSKLVFGFSQLKSLSYIEARNDSTFFVDFIERLKKLSGLDWNTV